MQSAPIRGEHITGPLRGLKVIERAEGITGPYCAKLLADLGAEVIKVEQPGVGDPRRRMGPFFHDDPSPDSGLLFNYLNVNKLGITLDLSSSLGHEWFLRLIKDADLFVFGGDYDEIIGQGLEFDGLTKPNPLLVATYITPFGLTGPYHDRRGGELVLFHMSALGYLTPGQKGTSKELPPLKAGGHQAQMVAGLSAASATLHGLFARDMMECAQKVDVSELESIASFQFMDMGRWVYSGDPGHRGERDFGQRIRCKDGEFNFGGGQERMWQAWIEVMGNPEWAQSPEFQDRITRSAHMNEIKAHIETWAANHTKEEIYRMGQARRVPVFPEQSIAEVVNSAQIESRGFLKDLPLASGGSVRGPSSPYQFKDTPWIVRHPAPRLGQHNREILCSRLGLSESDLASAFEAGII